jgi:DHA1 family inner membrane transport protein
VSILPLLALALATFSIGSTEFAIQGLLPEVSADLGVSIPKAGLLVTGYALGAAIGGPILVVLANGLPRKITLLSLMGVFILGHIASAIAPDYTLLMIARVVAASCHGAFFGIGSVVAVSIVPEDRRASAVALMWGGVAASNIFGVPAGTALGHAFGWRATFWAVTLIGVIATIAIAAWVPRIGRAGRTSLRDEVRVLAKPQVLLTLGLTVLIAAGTFSVFTYIAPLLIETTGVSSASLPFYLLLFGVGGVIGMQIGGRFADWRLMGSIVGLYASLVVIYLILLFAFRSPVAAGVLMFVWGFAIYFPAAPLQVRMVTVAHEGPNLASTMMQSGFHIGNAMGPFFGGAALAAGFGYALLPWIGAVMALLGLGVALWSVALDRRTIVQSVRSLDTRHLR